MTDTERRAHLLLGLECLSQGQIVFASLALKAVGDKELFRKLGEEAIRYGMVGIAVESFSAAGLPCPVESLRAAGRQHLAIGERHIAFEAFRAALDRDGLLEVRRNCLAVGEVELAAKAAAEAGTPLSPAELLECTQRSLERADVSSAVKALQMAGRSPDPEEFRSWGHRFAAAGNRRAALAAFEAVGAKEELEALGHRCLEQGDHRTALSAYWRAKVELPTERLLTYARKRLRKGQLGAAVEAIRSLRGRGVWWAPGVFRTSRGELGDAIDVLKRLCPGDLRLLGRACLRRGRYSVGIRALSALGDREELLAAGRFCLKKHKRESAMKAYRAAVRLGQATG